MKHIEEAIIEEIGHGADNPSEEWLSNDKFYTLTMAEILERQGLKKDAMKIYQALLTKGGENSLIIKEKIERLKYGNDAKGLSSQAYEDKKKDFINWVNKLQRGGS